jgi:uncharacterized protein (DUF433 family)
MSDEDFNPVDALADRYDDSGDNIGVSLNQVKNAIKGHGELRRERLTGEPDFAGEKVTSIGAEVEEMVEPMAQGWRETIVHKYPHLDGMQVELAAEVDPNFRRELELANGSFKAVLEAHRRLVVDNEGKKFKRLRPQAYTRDGEVVGAFRKDAVDYLREVKGMTTEQIAKFYGYGGFGKATEQAKVFDASNAWARDKRELMELNDKRENEGMTLRDAQRRAALTKRLNKA